MGKCGSSWRKPVAEITDRQKRYRANHPDCRPKGPKVCFKCGSRRFITVDHIDGDEANGKRSNLRWACKSHNTLLGMKMAKAGKGVRTRQYNPRRKNPGATSLAQYVQAAMDHVRGSHDAGGKVLHETPKSVRREFAREIWFRRGYRGNPPQDILPEFWAGKLRDSHGRKVTEPKQAKAILLSELRALGDIPERNNHKNKKNNKNNPSAADELYRAFHGRGPDKITTMLVAGIDPYGGHPELTSLGPLIRLVVGENVELSNDGEVENADWVNEILFVPSMREYRSITERLDSNNMDDVRRFKGWLKSVGAPDVAAVPNTRQLYFVGGNQNLDEQLERLGADPEKDLADLGFVYLIEYFAQKRFDRFEPTTYFHQFGEKSGVLPRLGYLRVPKRLLLMGGEYVVRSVGIDN